MAKNLPDELADIGKDILRDVSIAIEKNDYSKLASDIANSVKAAAVISIERKTNYASGKQNTAYKQPNIYAKPYNQQQYQKQAGYAPFVNTKQVKPFPFFMKRVPRNFGAGKVLFGSLGTLFVFPIMFSALFGSSLGVFAFLLLVFSIFVSQIVSGAKKQKLIKTFYEYGRLVGNVEYFEVSSLASKCLKTDEQVLRDLKKMIKEGFLPRAKFDATEKTLMITDEAYNLYLGAEKDKLEREKKALEADKAKKESLAGMPTEVKDILSEGDDYIKFVRKINQIIPDTEEMSNKLYRLEEIMNRIFEQVKKDNQSADDLHKLMNYYLPTTKKLLSAYVELDKQQDAGENIVQTKMEISEAMDTINMAFEKLLDSLFQDMAWDISSDISVMKTMLAQDGLTTESGGVAMQVKE